jgi:anti-sigma factor RsiW
MTPRIPDTHAEAWDLLPWLANGRITAADREWVEAHVQACDECRAELSAQRMLAGNLRDAGAEPVVSTTEEQRSFDKLWARIEAAESATSGTKSVEAAPRRASRPVRWLAAAVVVQGFGLALFGINALRAPDAAKPGFVTVTSEAPNRTNAPMVSLVFAPEASIDTINTLLTHQGLSIVSGPGLSGNFTAALSPDAVASGASAESVAAVVSKDPNVTFAQPIAR